VLIPEIPVPLATELPSLELFEVEAEMTLFFFDGIRDKFGEDADIEVILAWVETMEFDSIKKNHSINA